MGKIIGINIIGSKSQLMKSSQTRLEVSNRHNWPLPLKSVILRIVKQVLGLGENQINSNSVIIIIQTFQSFCVIRETKFAMNVTTTDGHCGSWNLQNLDRSHHSADFSTPGMTRQHRNQPQRIHGGETETLRHLTRCRTQLRGWIIIFYLYYKLYYDFYSALSFDVLFE